MKCKICSALTYPWNRLKDWVDYRHVRVGVTSVATYSGKVLLGERAGCTVGSGLLQFSGGKQDRWETVEDCAVRELWEETNLHGYSPRIFAVTNNAYPEKGRHFTTIWVHLKVVDISTLRNREPHKCLGWHLYDPEEVPYGRLFEGENVVSPEVLNGLLENSLARFAV